MKAALECLPCFLNQTVAAVRRFGLAPEAQDRVMTQVLCELTSFDRNQTSPVMGAFIDRAVARAVGVDDPYAEEKRRCNNAMLSFLPSLRKIVEASPDPFETAVKAAVIGNFIDFTAPGGDTKTPLPKIFDQALSKPLTQISEDALFRLKTLSRDARSILYLMDNAGEIAADRLLLEQLPKDRVTAAVRGGPIANDALMEDARIAGITDIVEVIANGVALPGTLLSRCSKSFRARFEAADLIISKGQGNFETLDFIPEKLFFLFVVKCPTVADYLGSNMGDLMVCDRRNPASHQATS